MPYPDEYRGLENNELRARVKSAKEKLGKRLMILGHYYQRDEVIEFADATGDSYKLAEAGAGNTEAEFIVFCGVHFMAEVSDILAAKNQKVFMPEPGAGCPLADMAEKTQVEDAWAVLERVGVADDVVPVTYINSLAELKAFCGKHGGTVCTSSSAPHAFDWALKQKSKIFFFPDENLGRNTAHAKGFSDDDMVVWDPHQEDIIDVSKLKSARVILWKGFCHVHTFFTMDHIRHVRDAYPNCKIAVHPECNADVVDASDAVGSTSFLVQYAKDAPEGSTVVIGTEINLVSRIACEMSSKKVKVVPLARSLCPNMFKTSLRDLCYTLEELPQENRIRVPEYIRGDAKVALKRMLALK